MTFHAFIKPSQPHRNDFWLEYINLKKEMNFNADIKTVPHAKKLLFT